MNSPVSTLADRYQLTNVVGLGVLADRHGLVGNVGDSVTLAVLAVILAVGLLLVLPETAGRDLDELRLDGPP